AIWYQGESNAGEAYNYRSLFPNMINDWRDKWNDNFPFLWVQLANFMAPDSIPAQSDWAELREAQSLTLSLPATGQAVTSDIGERDDIHPKNKQDVGYRLALAAEKIAYGKDVVYSGPQYQSMTKENNKIVLSFSNTGSGLMLKDKYGYAKGFAIAGEDKKFVWAKAYLDGGKMVVYSDEIRNPVAVRYAWGNNPDDANLYNEEGLPASAFRTDEWTSVTQKN
ncbi:MAG: sialate O-acetylesterase, partial [Ginsengibacter sp.]